MNRPSTFEDRLQAWLDEGPTSGPDDLLTSAHARARSVRQRPAWWVSLKGETMETTWRARPALVPGRLAFLLLTALLLVALAATTVLVGSRLISRADGGDGAMAVVPAIPTGDDALFAFTTYSSSDTRGDLFVIRADGTDSRMITSDALDDWSPAWSPDGSRIAFYSGDDDSVQLRVASADGITALADAAGCWNPTSQPPAWSPDGRFILHIADRDPSDDVCDEYYTDIFVVPADGSAPGRRLLAEAHTEFTGQPAWDGDQIIFRASPLGEDGELPTESGLWIADVSDPEAPWDLEARRIDHQERAGVGSFHSSVRSPDGTRIASTWWSKDGGYGIPVVIPVDGGEPLTLWTDASVDAIAPAWSPDGSQISLLVMRALLTDYAIYQLYVMNSDGTEPRLVDTPDLTGNAGPARFSPDGTKVLVRLPRGPMPGDVAVVDLEGDSDPVLLFASQWSTMDWQPVVNPENPAARAPEGLPAA